MTSGNVYVQGFSIVSSSWQGTGTIGPGGNYDAFVAKYNSTLTSQSLRRADRRLQHRTDGRLQLYELPAHATTRPAGTALSPTVRAARGSPA